MTQNNNSRCCSGTPGCCGVISNNAGKGIKINNKKITIDFLYLDLMPKKLTNSGKTQNPLAL